VTDSNIDYTGSITIDAELMKAADILPYERVQIVNLNNGARIETYVIEGKKGSGAIEMNGGAARYAVKGDKLLIMSYIELDEDELINYRPKVIFVDTKNRITKIKGRQ